MAIVTDAQGNEFLNLILVSEDRIEALNLDAPVTHSLIVARNNQGNVLLIFNKYRNYWELPGGVIDDGETPRQCAVRELREETNQYASSILFKGLMKFHLQPGFRSSERIEYGALFSGHVDEMASFVENDEAATITWWDGQSDFGYINEIDKALIEYV